MATSNIKKDDEGHEQWEAAETIHNQHQWSDSSDDDIDHKFYDAHDTDLHHNQSPPPPPPSSTSTNDEAELLHKRLNDQLSTDDTPKKKSPG
jgi:hypothetical protein